MPIPKFVPAGICTAIFALQLWVSFPLSKELRSWYWPFLPYPMYVMAHERDAYLISPQLRVAACGTKRFDTVLTAEDVGIPAEQLSLSLVYIARAPHAPRAERASARMSHAIEAQFPGRYCDASTWLRVVSVNDTSTHHVYAKRRLAAEWPLQGERAK